MASHCYDEKAALLCDGFLSPTYGCSETLKNKIEVKRLGYCKPAPRFLHLCNQ